MAKLLYNLSIYAYQFIIWLVSPFNQKAKLWIEGRKDGIQFPLFDVGLETSEHQISNIENRKTAWFHCASLGEFEQGRPVIEQFKKTFPDYKILLTFFSPSGYEIRKNYEGADFICYLPSDTPTNAREFIEKVNPSIAFFVKYEFWYNYLHILQEKQIPVVSFSAIFRENQLFFKWYGGFHRNILKYFSHIFVQNQSSLNLLQNIGIQNVSIGGDTRFDRVQQIANARKELPIIKTFKNEKPLLIVGSCWQQDFEVLLPFLNKFEEELKIIIAPHEIHDAEIESWRKALEGQTVRYSEIESKKVDLQTANCLIIDNIGMLSSLYQYADFAWIGGAYGKGLHNILEAATFGLPIFFGNEIYKKFQEAVDLEQLGGAKAIANTAEFEQNFVQLYKDSTLRQNKTNIIRQYVQENLGGTDKIINYVTRTFEFGNKK
ncbi:3-deoxy-D-manno-octulosonic-acid transferase [Arcicella aurantiaca]|uniref:3-deoxy-D-manno-octulosonic acid transferase n=1 Tax=Arcicella aurantiaca TaxID=591202 RepID=A0A316EDS3_9BACT|nr:glycosyltransferase N-terminal domain-containing protein [Arcicella aurantiaca]PWK26787.1 3-deoxy-D-manno-octulosonic-acid transferase [Arcicella aurantiaca]